MKKVSKGLSPDEIEYKKRQLLFKLQQLNSPVLASVDASAHEEFILVCLQPSDIRMQLLEWLFFKYDPTLVQAVKVPPHSTEDLRTLKITAQSSLLGFSSDPKVIQGATSIDSQLIFLENLVDFVHLSFHIESNQLNIDTEHAKTQTLLDAISKDHKNIFSKDIGIHQGFGEYNPYTLYEPLQPITPELLKQLNDSLIKVRETSDFLTSQIQEMSSVTKQFNYTPLESQSSFETQLRSLPLEELKRQLEIFTSLVNKFNQMYNLEIKQWIKPVPKFEDSEFADVVRRVSEYYQSFSKTLDNYHKIKTSYTSLISVNLDDLQNVEELGEPAIYALKDSIDILEKAIKRREMQSKRRAAMEASAK